MSNISYTVNEQSIDQVMLDLRNFQGRDIDLVFEDSHLLNRKDVSLIVQSLNRYKINFKLFGTEKAVGLFASMGYNASPIKKFKFSSENNKVEDSVSYKIEEDGQASSKNEPSKLPDEVRVVDGKSSRQKRKSLRSKDVVKIMVSMIFITASLVLLSMFLLIPSADVKITVASRETEQDIAFQVSRNITEVDNLRNIVPATVITQEFEKTQEFETQGRRVEGTKAEGVVILYNEQRAVQPLLPRTRLRLDGTDLIFRTQAAVRIPPATNAGPGTIEVGVDPDIEGSETNAKEGQRFTVVNLSGFLQERVYARAKSDFSGGTTTNIPQVSQSEIDEAKNTLTEALVSESLNSMREQEENDQYIITNGSWWTEAKDVSVSNAVGDEVDKFTVTAKVEVNVLTFKQSDLASLIENDFADNLDDGQRLARQKFTDLQITNLDQFKGDAELNGKVKFLVKNDIDLDEIKNEIAGKTKLDAEDILQDMVPGMQEIQRFSISPDWSSNMPILTSRINITVQEIAQEESAL